MCTHKVQYDRIMLFLLECRKTFDEKAGIYNKIFNIQISPHIFDPDRLLSTRLLQSLRRSMWVAIFPQKATTTVCLGFCPLLLLWSTLCRGSEFPFKNLKKLYFYNNDNNDNNVQWITKCHSPPAYFFPPHVARKTRAQQCRKNKLNLTFNFFTHPNLKYPHHVMV